MNVQTPPCLQCDTKAKRKMYYYCYYTILPGPADPAIEMIEREREEDS